MTPQDPNGRTNGHQLRASASAHARSAKSSPYAGGDAQSADYDMADDDDEAGYEVRVGGHGRRAAELG